MKPAIEFRNVSKGFRRHAQRILLRTVIQNLLARRNPIEQEFLALKGVSFRIEPGERVAIVGSNGAGKSTMLSLVARLVPPDRGEVCVNGRVSALLELGSGFHPDLTGAENAKLNASLIGITKKHFEEIYPNIVDFAEIGDFIHEPLRTYSTGMGMRLAFAVAICVDPDILLIDEVLAVGDTAFQQKCFNRILDFARRGKTILCVSHSASTVRELCTRGIWLDHGDLMMDGPLAEVTDAYEGRFQAAKQT
jgi:ABC-type polysaccharide/polyol phosphate transport system ATPase subunit